MPPLTPLPLIDAALRGMLVAFALLLAFRLQRERPGLPAARAGVALCLGLCVQAVGSTPLLELLLPWRWQVPLVAVAVANVVLFWLFVRALFDDGFTLRPVHGAVWLAVALLSGFNCAMGPGGPAGIAPVTIGLQRAVPLLFAVLAAMAAAAQWRADLVEGRRRLRVFIVATGVVYTLAMLVARLGSPQGRLLGLAATVDVAGLVVMVAGAAFAMLGLGSSELFPLRRDAVTPDEPTLPEAAVAAATQTGERAEPVDAPDPADDRLAGALQRLMSAEHAYRAEDLSVASLAARLAVPEYRLRRLINRRLGHRNFNAYVNGLRLAEARAALADPGRRALPVLSIALESGFQSIGPFNRAFKAATGLTPTEFRRENLADS